MVQNACSAVVQYVRDMGADPLFITEMSKADPGAINPLSEEQHNAYKVNYTLRTITWSYNTDPNGQLVLEYSNADEWKKDQAQFYCDRSGTPRLFLWLIHDT